MAERDMELKVILDQLAAWRNKYGVRHITVSVGRSGQYGEFKKDETPGAATPRESRN